MRNTASTSRETGPSIGSIPALAIAERFGTPSYAYDATRIRARYRALRESIRYQPLQIHYAVKAQANVALLRMLVELGAGLDACSPGDLAFAQAAGCTADRVSYTACGLSNDELRAVHQAGVVFIADSLDQLERYGRLGGQRAVGLRTNTGVTAGFHAHVRSGGPTSKFGVHPHQVRAAAEIARAHGLQLTWLHSHLGSDILNPRAPIEALDRLLAMGDNLPDLKVIDVGGGWGVPFSDADPEFDLDAYGIDVAGRLDALSRRRGREITLVLEPGAFLMQDAAHLLTRVTELKPPTLLDGRSTPHFAYVDANCGHTISRFLYGTTRTVHAVVAVERPPRTYDICGSLLQAGDVFARDVALPELKVGDVLAIANCGSYCAVRASTFNERPRPAEVLVDGERIALIRRAETIGDLLSTQVVEP